MFPNRLAFAALGIACVAAAGGGAYVATRQNLSSAAVPIASASAPAEVTAPIAPPDAAGGAAGIGSPAPQGVPAPARGSAAAVGAAPGRLASRPDPSPIRKNPPMPAPHAGRTTPPEEGTPAAAAASSGLTPAFEPSVRDEPQPADPARPPLPPAKRFEELIVAADSVVGLRTEGTVSSESSRVEDRVEARVVRDVRVNGEVAIPAGSRAMGTVVLVERGGKLKERARLGIRFHELVLPDNSRLPLSTETIYRYGDAPGNSSTAKIGGGAVAGAILGAIIGGGKGAAIGATTGAGAGGAAVAAGDRSIAVFPSGANVTARILSPVTVTVERE